mmetsp:Transcript_58938/g.140696  ORF Transcript_58938/g.140696 Transcript_58938/m.140696 type:complete len:324 (-) Transcript_58938:829-1800(-)
MLPLELHLLIIKVLAAVAACCLLLLFGPGLGHELPRIIKVFSVVVASSLLRPGLAPRAHLIIKVCAAAFVVSVVIHTLQILRVLILRMHRGLLQDRRPLELPDFLGSEWAPSRVRHIELQGAEAYPLLRLQRVANVLKHSLDHAIGVVSECECHCAQVGLLTYAAIGVSDHLQVFYWQQRPSLIWQFQTLSQSLQCLTARSAIGDCDLVALGVAIPRVGQYVHPLVVVGKDYQTLTPSIHSTHRSKLALSCVWHQVNHLLCPIGIVRVAVISLGLVHHHPSELLQRLQRLDLPIDNHLILSRIYLHCYLLHNLTVDLHSALQH